jgi:hypothetical protein
MHDDARPSSRRICAKMNALVEAHIATVRRNTVRSCDPGCPALRCTLPHAAMSQRSGWRSRAPDNAVNRTRFGRYCNLRVLACRTPRPRSKLESILEPASVTEVLGLPAGWELVAYRAVGCADSPSTTPRLVKRARKRSASAVSSRFDVECASQPVLRNRTARFDFVTHATEPEAARGLV